MDSIVALPCRCISPSFAVVGLLHFLEKYKSVQERMDEKGKRNDGRSISVAGKTEYRTLKWGLEIVEVKKQWKEKH